jgi:hypothetical protein
MAQLVNSLVVQDDKRKVLANVDARMLINPIGIVLGIQPSPTHTWANVGADIASRVKTLREMNIIPCEGAESDLESARSLLILKWPPHDP